jgi:hypothetical protein
MPFVGPEPDKRAHENRRREGEGGLGAFVLPRQEQSIVAEVGEQNVNREHMLPSSHQLGKALANVDKPISWE